MVCVAHPGVHTTRTLMLVAKVVQRIANLSVFANQEEFMNPLNKLIGMVSVEMKLIGIEENTETMRKFINEISVKIRVVVCVNKDIESTV